MPPTRELPDIANLFAPLLARVSEEQRPLLIALAERMAAQRYRGWADASPDTEQRDRLLACAEREDGWPPLRACRGEAGRDKPLEGTLVAPRSR